MLERETAGRQASHPVASDSQSIKAPHAKVRGYNTGRRSLVVRDNIAVDTYGRLLLVRLTPADISDSAAG